MSVSPITLEQCTLEGKLRTLPEGSYTLEYSDATHLPRGEWVRLAVVEVREASTAHGDENVEPFYTIKQEIGELPGKPGEKKEGKQGNAGSSDALVEYASHLRTVADALSLALARVGLLAPEVRDELLRQVTMLGDQDGVVIVPDTNALHNGALHWLLRVLQGPAIWILPLVASITTVQTRDAILKGLLSKPKLGNLRSALRSRGLVNGSLGLLERNKGRCQVMEIDPALLRYQKMASGSSADPDQGDVLEDRLIIEGIHGVLRSMRSRTARRVVTSDVNIARVLAAEGIDTLFIPIVEMGNQTINCLHYDPLVRGFVGAPLRAVLWELTHVFGSVRLVRDKAVVAELDCYWPGKSPADWSVEKLRCTLAAQEAVQTTPGRDIGPGIREPDGHHDEGGGAPVTQAEEPSAGERGSAPQSKSKPAAQRSAAQTRPSRPVMAKTPGSPPTTTALPRASLPQVLRLLGALRKLKSAEVEQVVAASKGASITIDNARRAFEVLRRVRLLDQQGKAMRVTGDAEIVDAALRRDDLDVVSEIFQRFEPYRVFSQCLREQGHIARAEVFPILKDQLGPIGTHEGERLPRFHVLLGQAWSAGDVFADGSNRPTDRDATDAFGVAFASTASVGLAKVVDLLPRFCEITRMSPWAAKRQIGRLVSDRLLPEYSFQPAAGGKPVVRDEIISGGLDALTVEPVVIDRIHLGERPVFTVGGPAR